MLLVLLSVTHHMSLDHDPECHNSHWTRVQDDDVDDQHDDVDDGDQDDERAQEHGMKFLLCLVP